MSTAEQPNRKRLSLSDAIIGSVEGLQERIVVQGQGGMGKTGFGAASEDSFFLLSPGETGLHTLMRAGIVSDKIPNIEVAEWLQVFDVLEELRTAKHSRKTVVVDTIDGLWKCAERHELITTFKGDNSTKQNGFNNFAAGSRHTAKLPWQEFLAALDKLHRERKMQIILLAHTGKSPFRNPMGDDYDRMTPDMYKDGWNATYNWADITLYMDRAIATSKGDGKFDKTKGKGVGDRMMLTEYGVCHDAKNRHNLPYEIEMGDSGKEAWSNFVNAKNEARETQNGGTE